MVHPSGLEEAGRPPWLRHRPGPRSSWVLAAAGPTALGLLVLGASLSMRRWEPGARQIGALQVGLLLLAFAALVARHRRPLPAYAVSCAAAAGFLLSGGQPGPLLLAPFWGLVSVVAARDWRLWGPAAAGGGVLLDLAHLSGGLSVLPELLFLAVWLLCAGAVGMGLTVRRRFRAEVEARSRWAQRSQVEEERRVVAEERLRIAREVHDVVGHSLAVISLQAGVAEHLLGSRPQEARQAVTAIRRVSRQALGELRSELASLRSGAGAEVDLAAPGLARIPALVDELRAAGLQVTLQAVDPGRVPAAVGAAAYRIVQEALTNVARHARPGARVKVQLERGPSSLRVEVTDDSEPTPETAPLVEGHGIAGMRERVAELRGSLDVERHPTGVRIRAEIPLETTP
jgi:signal transduction histidine kinase